MMQRRGKLIVIDGSDGSGKATQTKLLVAHLRREGHKAQTLDFPQYNHNLLGQLLSKCLAGASGDFVGLDAHIASVLYAADRFESKKKIEKWLAEGRVVVLDRYVSANQIHQGGKIRDKRKRREFLRWLEQLEYGVFGLPRPDLVLCLDLPVKESVRFLRAGPHPSVGFARRLLDQAERNTSYLKHSRDTALELANTNKGWVSINCMSNQGPLTRGEVHKAIWAETKKLLQ